MMGTTCSHWSSRPASTSASPATTRPFVFSTVVCVDCSHCPAHMPSIIVAIVGMKLSVDQPPLLNRKGDCRGNRLRNQTSNAHARLEFLLKCARNPVYRCGQSVGTPTLA